MLSLRRLEVEGFGPFADRQVIEFPEQHGVTVIYGENMRGKTSLLNAVRYAFFGKVLGRGSRVRKIHSISNRERALVGEFGFKVTLTFAMGGVEYELVRSCVPKDASAAPQSDDDYRHDVMLRRGRDVLGPHERDRVLAQVFPEEISRFFLFDGELLQEYEELLINESTAGQRISEAIERVLGVPILKRGRMHLRRLAEDADRTASREASKHKETEAIGAALQQAIDQKAAHRQEVERLTGQLTELNTQKQDLEQYLQSRARYASLLKDREAAEERLRGIDQEKGERLQELREAMATAWRGVLSSPLREARQRAQSDAKAERDALVIELRRRAVQTGHCDTCDQDVDERKRQDLRSTLRQGDDAQEGAVKLDGMARLEALSRIDDTDNSGQIRLLSSRLDQLEMNRYQEIDAISDLKAALRDSDPEALRNARTTYSEVHDRIAVIKQGIREEEDEITAKEQNIKRLNEKLESMGTADLKATRSRAGLLRQSEEVFSRAVERYKADLRTHVEETATRLFREMTTEKEDYAGLVINDSYGLAIQHRDGRLEEARSAGAEHVVALALMGALQNNAPLRGPIVMDSPFGRLDELHTSNVVRALPEMAEQVILLVYEQEVGPERVRELLGSRLVYEYKLDRVTSRRTNVRKVA